MFGSCYNACMAKLERFQKELDYLLDKLRFWRLSLLSITAGIFGLMAKKSVDNIDLVLMVVGLGGIVISLKRIAGITRDYYKILEKIEIERE